MNKIKLSLNKRLLGLLYWCVLECMTQVDRNTPPKRVDDLQELEILINSLLVK